MREKMKIYLLRQNCVHHFIGSFGLLLPKDEIFTNEGVNLATAGEKLMMKSVMYWTSLLLRLV